MAVTVKERYGRVYGTDHAEKVYLATGAADEEEARAAILATAPGSYGGCYRKTAVLKEIEGRDGEYDATVSYVLRSGRFPTGAGVYTFDTTGGTSHIVQAIKNVSNNARSGEDAPDHDGAIGVFDGNVEGCDITIPVYSWSETHYLDADDVTTGYRTILFALTGAVNSDSFRGLAAGEVLFLGATGSRRDDESWEITFKFASSPNRTSFKVPDNDEADGIPVASKAGWDYMWIEYEDAVANNAPIKRPAFVHIEQVYPRAAFSQLGISDDPLTNWTPPGW